MKSTRRTKNEILFCCHAAWLEKYGYTIIPENTYLYIYAPVGAALSQSIPRALASGEEINPGDLTIRRINPIKLFNLGYENRGNYKDNYTQRDKEVMDYPFRLGPGESVPNFIVTSPGKDSLKASDKSNLIVMNIKDSDNAIYLEDLLRENAGNTCHFGGCSWIREDNDKRDIVTFKNKALEDRFSIKLSEDEKRAKREERFGKKF